MVHSCKEVLAEFNRLGINDYLAFGKGNVMGKAFGLQVRDYNFDYGIQNISVRDWKVSIEYRKGDWRKSYKVMVVDTDRLTSQRTLDMNGWYKSGYRLATPEEQEKIFECFQEIIDNKKAYIESLKNFSYEKFTNDAFKIATEYLNGNKEYECKLAFGKSQSDSYPTKAIVVQARGNNSDYGQMGYIRLIEGYNNEHEVMRSIMGIRSSSHITPDNLKEVIEYSIKEIID